MNDIQVSLTMYEYGELAVAVLARYRELLDRRRIYGDAGDLPNALAGTERDLVALRSLAAKLSLSHLIEKEAEAER